MIIPKFSRALLCLLILFSTSVSLAQDLKPEPKSLRLGLVAGVNPAAVIKQWALLADAISEASGLPVDMVLRENYDDLLEAMKNGDVDLIEGGAYLYTRLHDELGASPLLIGKRDGSAQYRSIIVVRSDSDINNLRDLKNHSFTFTDPYSTSGYLYPRIMLAAAGITDPKQYLSSTYFIRHHDTALNAVLSRAVDAAGVGSFVYENLEPKKRKQLKIIAESELITYGPISYRQGLPEGLINKIRSALLNIHEKFTPSEKEQMANLDQFVPAKDDAYDPLREKNEVLSQLPPVDNSIHYRTAPVKFGSYFEKITNKAILLISVPMSLLILIVLFSFIILHRKAAKSLKVKLILACICTNLVILIIFSVATIFELQTKIKNQANEFLWDLKTFEAGCVNSINENKLHLLQMHVDDFASRKNIVYAQIIHSGRYIADSRHQDTGRNISENVLNDRFYLSKLLKQPMIEITDPIIVGDKNWGLILTGFSIEDINNMINRTLLANIIIILIATSLSVFLAYIIASRITRNLGKLTIAAQNIRKGRDKNIVAEGEDEIGKLSKELEQMRVDLKLKDDLLKSKMEEIENPSQIVVHDPFETKKLRDKIALIEESHPELKTIRTEKVIGDSPAFLKVVRDIYIRSQDSDPVLIYGESGSGKTGVAHAIHELSERSKKPFGEFNCAEFASADPLIVLGKLFGYGKDSGIQGIPKEGMPGLLQKYDGGTLFLDEVASLPSHAQAILLLPLEGRPFNAAAGSGSPITVNVRFIFASNTLLLDEVTAGRFRKDLIRRIRVRGRIDIPPLRGRKEDIPALANHFVKKWSEETGNKMEIAPEIMNALVNYDYEHFNIGELLSTIRVSADNAFFEGKQLILSEHLPAELRKTQRRSSNISWTDKSESEELTVLRKNAFKISMSEEEIGYPKNSKTLTNHFRGLCYKALSMQKWNLDGAAKLIAGDESSNEVLDKIRKKLKLYLDALLELIKLGREERLFNNLPQKYFRYIEEAKNHFKNR